MILVVDTCGPLIGVGVLAGDHFEQHTARIARGAETLLVPWAIELLGSSSPVAIGVTVGPGAFTGLRVGLATAQGFAQGYGAPLFGFCSLQIRGEHAGADAAWLDARKGRVYAARRDADWQGSDIDPDRVAGPGLHTGEGALVYRDRIEAAGGTVVADAEDPGLKTLALRTRQALQTGRNGDPLAIGPVYLREPDAVPPKRPAR